MPNDFLSDEDKALFRQTVGAVRAPEKSQDNEAPLSLSKTDSLYLSDHYTEIVQAQTLLSYCCHPIPAKRLLALKRGQIPWQSRLDLHGLRPEAAKEALISFIRQQYSLAHRCLLIIHGKGGHRGQPPVLKNLVNHWLRQFPQVLAFHSALTGDGGSGAVYTLLKKQAKIKS